VAVGVTPGLTGGVDGALDNFDIDPFVVLLTP